MAQGKLKVRTKVPVKKGKSVKGAAVTKRASKYDLALRASPRCEMK